MKVNKAKKSIKVISFIILILVAFCIIDTVRASYAKKPLFCLPLVEFKNGGVVQYYGLGYSIYKEVNYKEYREKNTMKDSFDWSAKYFYLIPVELYDCQKN